MAFETVEEILENLEQVDPARIQGMEAVLLFDLSGEGGGKWTVKVADEKLEVEEGEAAEPNLTLTMAAQDLLDLANGKLNAIGAFMQGKIKVSGDMALAMRLQNILT